MALNAPITAHSQAAFQHPLTLGTHTAIKTCNRTLNRVDAALYLTTIISRLQGSASRLFESEIAQVSEAIGYELRGLGSFLDSTHRTMQKLLKTATPTKESSHLVYTQPTDVILRVRTPKANDYIRLIHQLEQTSRQLDQLWALGALTELEHLQRQNDLFRKFSHVCQTIERLARGLARRVQGQDREVRGVYRDMLLKRTGRSPGQENPDPIPAEESENMTRQEAENLVEMETLAFHLNAGVSEPDSATSTAPDSRASASEASVVLAEGADAPEPAPETASTPDDADAPVADADADAGSVGKTVTTHLGAKTSRRRISEILAERMEG